MRYGFLFALFKRSHDHLRGFLIAAWAGDKIAEFSFPEISFHFPLRPWFFFVSPAYAGKSSLAWPRRWWRRDHPRVCGEKEKDKRFMTMNEGSPPRMRGKAFPMRSPIGGPRITPAYAGKSGWWPPVPCRCGDHPRVCGEKCRATSLARPGLGSPPRMRGKVSHAYKDYAAIRITPRVCGEKIVAVPEKESLEGSPPPMRGKVLDVVVGEFAVGITPAYAGKSWRPCSNRSTS